MVSLRAVSQLLIIASLLGLPSSRLGRAAPVSSSETLNLSAQLKQWLGPKRAALFPLNPGATVPPGWGTPLRKGSEHQDYLLVPSPLSRESADTILKLDPATGRITAITASIHGVPDAHLGRLKDLLSAEDLRAAERQLHSEKHSHSTGRVQVFPIASLNTRLHFNAAGALIAVEWTAKGKATRAKSGSAR
jgi:hypothetical protein